MITFTEQELEIKKFLEKQFSLGEKHFEFEIPKNPADSEKLWETLKSLAYKGAILLLSDPADSDDSILVEEFPPCCVPPIVRENKG